MAIKCEKAASLIDRKDTEKLTIKEAIQLRIHNINCKLCKGYNDFSVKFRHLFKSLKSVEKQTLTHEEKVKLKTNLKN